jgi:hypothetical protein
VTKPRDILRCQNIPELIVIVDDGVDLLATGRHGRGEGSVKRGKRNGNLNASTQSKRGLQKGKRDEDAAPEPG